MNLIKAIKAIFLSSVGRKYIMALTGAALAAFICVHLLGNLQLFLEPLKQGALNNYAVLLKSNLLILWGYRIGLGTIALIHIVTALSLWLENCAARPVKYAVNAHPYTDLSSRMMVYGGIVVFFFLIWHILDLTSGVTRPDLMNLHWTDAAGTERHDVYHIVLKGIGHPVAGLCYLVAVFFLFLHLWHGLESIFQSLGLRNEHFQPYIKFVTRLVAICVFVGMCSIPLACMLGVLK